MNTLAPESVQEFTIRDIARAFKTNKMKIRRTAEREAWPYRVEGNRVLFQPPANIASVIIGASVIGAIVCTIPITKIIG